MQLGIIYVVEEKDWKIVYLYFYEVFEGYDFIDSFKVIIFLKYMLLCKIMFNILEDVQVLVSGKFVFWYVGRQIEVLKCVVQVSKNRLLVDFEKVLIDYWVEFWDDLIISIYLVKLYDNLLEQNLI